MSAVHASASVKLSAALLNAARESADIACRSTAGQIEYWAKLGRSVELSGLATVDAHQSIRSLDFAGAHTGRKPVAAALSAKILAAHHSGSLAARVTEAVQANRAQAASAQTA